MSEKPYRKRVTAVVLNGNKVLITTHEAYAPYKGIVHEMPGGGVEDDQTPEDAVIAECAEEVGVVVRDVRQLDAMVHKAPYPVLKPGEGTQVQIERRKLFAGVESIAYVAKYVRTINGGNGTADDSVEWAWIDIDAAIKLMEKQADDRRVKDQPNMYDHMASAILAAKKNKLLHSHNDAPAFVGWKNK